MSTAASLAACLEYLVDRVLISLPIKSKSDKLVKQFHEDPNRSVCEDFIREPETRALYVFCDGVDRVVCSLQPEMKKKGVFLLKSKRVSDALKLDDLKSSVCVCECSENILLNLSLVSHEVFFPLLSNPNNRAGWSGPTAKEVMMKVSQFLSQVTITVGQSKGQTLLPHPAPEAFDEESGLLDKERIHLLETAVIQWANKVEQVLCSEPQQILKSAAAAASEADAVKALSASKPSTSLNQLSISLTINSTTDKKTAGEENNNNSSSNGTSPEINKAEKQSTDAGSSDGNSSSDVVNAAFPGPQFELDFWQNKQADLHSLSTQLSSPRLQQVYSILDHYASPYASQLQRLLSDVNACEAVCKENNRFLRSLRPYFHSLSEELDFNRLESVFHPLMHTLLLVFKHSQTYNTQARLTCLMQQLCNILVIQANKHVSGETVFRLIEDENTVEAVSLLKQTVRICSLFIQLFHHYQQKAATTLSSKAWEIKDDQLFSRLHSYIERANDLLDFCRIVLEFSKLPKIYIGGTKGKELTQTLWGIHTDFFASIARLRSVPYDICNITVSSFDNDYYSYRYAVKEMEHRLVAIIITAYHEAPTLTAKFQLFDSFEGILDRPIIKDELSKQYPVLLSAYLQELKTMSETFHKYKKLPKTEMNLPPVSGALSWVRSLRARVEEPMDKLKHYTGFLSTTGQREEMKEILTIYDSLVSQLSEYESTQLSAWSVEITATSDAKLQQSLLRRDPVTQLLYVNFDDQLIKLLREVKYLLILRINVPQKALQIYERAELYRQQIAHLEVILTMYNEMISTLHAVERPLVDKDILMIDEVLKKGITEFNWKNEQVNGFINESLEIVNNTYSVVKVMKENMGQIKKMMSEFAAVPLAERKNKPLAPADFEDNLRKLWQQRHSLLVEHGDAVNKHLEETRSAIGVEKSSPIWSAYVDYIQDAVRDGLAATIVNSLKFLCENLDSSPKNEQNPMLEIKLGLYGNEVMFNAEDTQISGTHSTRGSLGNADHASALLQQQQQALSDIATNSNALGLTAAPAQSSPVSPSIDSHSSLIRSNRSRRDVWSIISDWVENFYDIGSLIQRQDGSNYTTDLKRNEQILKYSVLLKKHLDNNARACEDIRIDYAKYEFLWKTDRQVEFHRFLTSVLAEQKQKQAEEEKKGNKEEKKENSGGLTLGQVNPTSSTQPGSGNKGTDDDKEKDSLDEDNESSSSNTNNDYDLLPLDKFEERILYYKEIAFEILEKKTPIEIGWLKINSQPIKIALQSWANRWITAFTSFLYNDVIKKLNNLDSLMREVNTGLMTDVVAGDSVTLKKVLGYIHSVRSQEKSTLRIFQPLRDTVSLLKKYGKNMDEADLKLLSDAPMKWDSTVNAVYKVKEKVNNLQNDEVDKIKEKVEAFEQELRNFRRDYKENAPFHGEISVHEAYDLIYDYHEQINQLEIKASKLTDLEKVFELNVSKHRQIKKCRTENKLLKYVWDMCSVVKHQCEDWKKTRWDAIDTDELLNETKKIQKSCFALPSEVQSWDLYLGLIGEVKNLLTVLPLVNLLHSPAMEDRHWRELKIATGKSFNKDDNFCLSNVLDLELHKYVNEVEYIVELANKESKISQQLKKIEAQWLTLELQFGVSPTNGITTVKRPDDILIALEENMAALQGMSGQGKYVEHFIEEVTKWQKLLNHAETVLYDWLDVQAKWSSLEAIFLGSKDIRIQLPEDAKRFDDIDIEWKTLMANARNTPNVLEACSTKGRSEKLQSMKLGLEMCEKSLFQYLETKRKAFPRFYFLSNAALLDILSSGHDPQAVQKHLGDCFDNIARLSFHTDSTGNTTKTATGMYSKEGEEFVPLAQDFSCTGAVEDWLNRLVTAMRSTLMDILSKAKFTADHWEIEKPRHKWVFDYPAQLALTASQIIWTEEVNSQFDAFADGNEQAMKEYATKVLASRLEQLIQLVLGELTHCDRVKIMTLITVDVHNRDVVQRLIDSKIQDASAFAWQSQMRMKWKADTKDCVIKVADASFNYSYEYVGNTGRLVITPLTDRCYITLTQALRLIMGGAPAGPAGTGKTETTKDLGRAMGLPVYVFNCSEQMNVQSLGTVFKGLAQTGAWGCFDEFNRIPIEVLSVVSTQVSCILNGVREKRDEFDFMGEVIHLVPTVGMFITMNPGYAGRTELPENLKALFRSCAMVVPDMNLICENMLMSEGFIQAQRLAKKFTTLYSLSSELLSKQKHYDWGLRATKAVLRIAGSLKRAEPKVDEDRILMRALRDSNLAKLVDEDKPIFRELINDLFPGLGGTERKVDMKLQEAIITVAQQRGLQAEETFVFKCLELAELLAIRHSVFVVGPAGSGKSEIWKTLHGAFKVIGRKSVFEVINPKAIRNNELYGWLSKTDWHDGVLSTVMRNMSRNKPPYYEDQVNKWVVLDGDIDPQWIETMNTVMDDNKMLTLVSNERIPLSPSMRMMFEISNLDNATPATVSRAGILYINAKDIGSKPFLDSWIEKRENDKEKSSLLALFNKYCTPEYLHEMLTAFARIIPVSEVTIIRTLCYLLEGLLTRLNEQKKQRLKSEERLDPSVEKEQFEANFVFAVIWAFGGAALVDKSVDTRKDFSDFFKRVFTTIKFPKEGHVFDYYPDPKTGKMVPWSEIVPMFQAPDDVYLVTKVFVPTVDTVSLNYVVDLLVQRQKHVLLVGTAGTGKTVLINNYLRTMNENMLYCNINLNYYTDAKALQAQMEAHVDKRSGRIYGPPTSKRLVYFIDDLNMPSVDVYGTQSPSCLLKQHMDYGGWWDVTKLEKKEIQDVQYIACMNPTAGSFTVDPRLQSLFATFACLLPSKKNLTHIYATVLNHHFNKFNSTITELVPKLIKATIELHDGVSLKFIPSTKKFHYQFNLRDLSNVFQGLCLAHNTDSYSVKVLVQLWYHECTRVFSDRLVSPVDVATFMEILDAKVKSEFKEVGDMKKEGDEAVIFSSFMSNNNAIPNYLPVENMSTLKATLEQKLQNYNEENPIMNLELFSLAIQHVARIARIIENPRGNALLIGVGGSGKQSLAKLASYICGYDVFQITVTQNYGLNDLKSDLQGMYMKAGVKNIPITWLLTDTQIVDDTWLVYVNDLLSSGHINDLFTAEDKDIIINSVRNEARQQGVSDTRDAMYDYFINQVRTNLHVVLCFSPVGEAFRIRCRKFPGLISCTTIDWFHPWPRDALISVANRFLADVDLVNADAEKIKANVAEHMAQVHLSVNAASTVYANTERRHNYTTPKSFLELIAFYKGLLGKKRAELKKGQSRLEKGIATLKQTHAQVADLKKDLQDTLIKVREKSEAATVLISKMGVERKKVEEQQSVAAVEADKAKSVSDIAAKISAECKKDLDAAFPILEKAKEAVACLSKASLTTLKSFASPPGNVLYVTNAVLILKQIPGKRDWANAKKMMKDVGKFLDELKAFDATNIDEDVIRRIQPILDEEWFNEESMKSFSEAAANLCAWVVNTVAYNKVYKNVAPKMAAQAKATEELNDAQAKLKVVEDKVAAMQAKLSAVTDSLKAATDEKNKVEAEAAECQQRLELANRLVNGLADENTRWGKSILQFEEKGRTLVGDTMLAAAFVSYIGAFNQKFRLGLWKEQWLPDLIQRQIPLTEGVDPLNVLATDSDFAKWKNEGLAADRISLENGAIITQCSRWPLMIDPQSQGVKWIKGRVKNLRVIQLSNKRWMQSMTQAITMGESVLIEGVGEDLDATLDPVLSRSIFTRGAQKMIKLGTEEIVYDEGFHLYLQTKLFNPHYRPEIFAQCTLINFIVTEEGLEEQLLALVVNKEKPELEEKRVALVRAINDYMVTLTDLENELLERLSNAPDDILSDVALIYGLEKTKQASMEIEQKVELAKKQEVSINVARNEFRTVAAESSWLYFLLIQLCTIDHMYQYSLDAFIGFFLKAMTRTRQAELTKDRVILLRESIRITVFTWVNRGLFEKHKLIFSSQLCFKLMCKGALQEQFDPLLYDYLIKGPKKLAVDKTIQLDWLPGAAWASIQKLIELPGFEKLAADMQASPNRFKEWYNKARPEDTPLPLEWRKLDDTNPFMKLLVVRAMRPDRMTVAMENYVRTSLGPQGKDFTECDAGKSFLDVLTASLDDATPVNPIFFILSPGADPVHSVEVIAKRTGYYESRFHRVALGEGQDVVAINRLETGHREGHWIVLENIHLMPRWNAELEKKLDDFAAEGSHPDFRVFLSAEPSSAMPIGILERSIKLTNEPPQGLKQNLKRAFASFERDEFEFKDPKVKSIIFGLCHFHSVMIERIKFGPKGWNKSYPFSTGDLMCSAQVLANYLENSSASDKVPWSDLRYIFGEILYGGHITDDWDRLLCSNYLEFYMREELLDEMEMYPFNENYPEERFRSPPVLAYDQYSEYIDHEMRAENPVAFGLHPNAEIAVKTRQCSELFTAILDLQPRNINTGSGNTDAANPQTQVQMLIQTIINDKAKGIEGINFNLEDIASTLVDERGPYQNVFLQECDRMNQLCREIRRSLKELDLGLAGELQMSDRMETLFQSLYLNRVPATWAKLAYPSQRSLSGWMDNLILRAAQLQAWTEEPMSIPVVTQISYLFNPQSFLTAIMQKTAQKQKMELDKLVIQTDVTRKTVEQTDTRARDGAYVYGLYLEGARWNWNAGVMEECQPREMSCSLPVVVCRAVLSEKMEKNGVYRCPCYKTQRRGDTYVFTAQLRTKQTPAKWVLAGAVLVMEVEE